MKLLPKFALGLALTAVAASCKEPRAGSGTGSYAMIALCEAAVAGTPLFGHQDDLLYGHSWSATVETDSSMLRSDVFSVSGAYPAVLGLDLGGVEVGDSLNIDDNDFGLMRIAARKHIERGGIVTLSWHPRNPLTGGDTWDTTSDKVVEAVLPEGGLHEMYMLWLSRVADFISSVEVDGKVPSMIFRPYHEYNGNWFWWSSNLCSAEEYKALWVMTYDYMAGERGLENLIWAISPNALGNGFPEWEERYPGDEYVDIIGLDSYSWGDREQFIGTTRTCLESLAAMCEAHGKLLALTETGAEGVPDEEWWTASLARVIEGLPVSYVLVWRNAYSVGIPDKADHYYAPFPGQVSEADFRKWAGSEGVEMLKTQ